MYNQITLYPTGVFHDEHIEKLNKLYGSVVEKIPRSKKRPERVLQIVAELSRRGKYLTQQLKPKFMGIHDILEAKLSLLKKN